jgi:hypothetical protein
MPLANAEPASREAYELQHDVCTPVRRARHIVYRTHLFVRECDSAVAHNRSDVTLITQMSLDRMHMLSLIARQWPGPIR